MRLVSHVRVTGSLCVLRDGVVLKVPPTSSKSLIIKELQTRATDEWMTAPDYCAMMAGPRGARSPKETTLRIKCQQPREIKGEDIQRGTFYHLEAAVEEVQVSLWM